MTRGGASAWRSCDLCGEDLIIQIEDLLEEFRGDSSIVIEEYWKYYFRERP